MLYEMNVDLLIIEEFFEYKYSKADKNHNSLFSPPPLGFTIISIEL